MRTVPLIAVLFASALWSQPTALETATAALERGDSAAAERILRTEAGAHPDDAWTLSLLGYSLDNQKRAAAADPFHRRAIALAPHSAEVLNNYGTHLWIQGDYAKAETVFASALAEAPTYFNVLYNLGVMATNAGHSARAREVLEAARLQQPRNVDVLYRLAAAEEVSQHWEDAATHLAQASQINPKRADLQKLLAFTAAELGALDDALAAWDRYLALNPADDAARLERGYTAVKLGKLEQGLADIEPYVARHGDDKVGHYELAQGLRTLDEPRAIREFDRALTLDPAYTAALAARGGLYYQSGRFDPALRDLEAAAALDPRDAAILDRLGQTYQSLDRTADALRALRQAAALAPGDSKIILHYGRALADAGQTAESKSLMDRFRQLGPEKKNLVPEGLVSYLALSPAERRADYRARVEKSIREHPGDAASQLEYLKLLLDAGDTASVPAVAHRITALKPAPELLADAGHVLLAAKKYDLARELLHNVATPAAQLDLALATSPSAALAGLRGAIARSPEQPEFRLHAAAILITIRRAAEALDLLDSPVRSVQLMKATTLELLHRSAEAAALLEHLRRQSPEWSAVWAAEGIIHAAHQRYPEAVKALEAAQALGARIPELDYFLAQARAHAQADAAHLDRFFAGSLVIPIA